MLDVDDFHTFKALCANQVGLVVEEPSVSTSGLSGCNLEEYGASAAYVQPRC